MIDKTMFFGSMGLSIIMSGLAISASVYSPSPIKSSYNSPYHQVNLDAVSLKTCGTGIYFINLPMSQEQLNARMLHKSVVAS